MPAWIRWTHSFRWSASAVGALLVLIIVSTFCFFLAGLSVFLPEIDD